MAEQTTQALLGTILALVLVLAIYPSCQRFFTLNPDEGYKDLLSAFDEMSGKLPKTKVQAQIRSQENSYMVGFNPSTTEFKWGSFSVKRPKSCKQDATCVCLCKETVDDMDDIDAGEIECMDNQMDCTKYTASQFSFVDEIKSTDFYDAVYKDAHQRGGSMKSGFILYNTLDDIEFHQPMPIWLRRGIDNKIYVTMNAKYPTEDQIKNGKVTTPSTPAPAKTSP